MISKVKQYIQKYLGTKKQQGIFAVLILLIVFVSLFSPIYQIDDIEVYGNTTVDSNIIIKASGIKLGESVFKLDAALAKKGISKVAYVDTVKIKTKFPNTVVINITESTECAYINFVGGYVGIDEKGKALNVKQKLSDVTKPIVYGIKISNFEIGSIVAIDNEQKTKVLFEMLGQIRSSGIEDKIQYMDINDFDNITFTLKSKISVKLGNTNSLKYKIAYLKSVLDELGDTTGGVIDITDTENVVYNAN